MKELVDCTKLCNKYPMIPMNTIAELCRYVNQRIRPGGFLRLVLLNDLFGAMCYADKANAEVIHHLCMLIYNEIPAHAWGSELRYMEWLIGGNEE